jgi:DNA repair protein RecO
MYTKYTTEAFVLKSENSGEANKYYYLFTRDLGMIIATAQGVRLEKSKLRTSLQEFKYCSVSVVRGKEIWRITSASEIEHGFSKISENTAHYRVYVQTLALLKRFLHGEEKNETLFEIVRQAFLFLETHTISERLIQNFEHIVVLRILHTLGYVGQTTQFSRYINAQTWTEEMLHEFESYKLDATSEINRSLKASHL